MFKENKYTVWYMRIINRAKERVADGYVEIHHIIPKCLGGSDEKDNLVSLTAREHFICHALLTKMSDNDSLKYACFMMTVKNQHHHNRYKCSSRLYEYVRKLNSIAASNRMKGISYNVGRVKYYNPETLDEKLFDSDNDAPKGWVKGSLKSRVSKNKGKKYYHNPYTKEVKAFEPHEEIPDGFIKGNPNADTSNFANIRGTCYYSNPKTGEEIRSNKKPEGWVKGRIVRWITNGVDNVQHNLMNEIPAGWKLGRTMNWKRNKTKNDN